VFLAYRVVFCDRSVSTELKLAFSAAEKNRSVGKKLGMKIFFLFLNCFPPAFAKPGRATAPAPNPVFRPQFLEDSARIRNDAPGKDRPENDVNFRVRFQPQGT
jgi:hypothetical protein